MEDYPVMLYRNSFDDWKIADDEDHEKELLKDGYMSHADFVARDKNDNGALDIAEMTKKDIMQGLDDFKNSTDDTQEVADLKAKLAIYEETKDVNGDGKVSYDEMTNTELQKLLEQRKVDYNKRDGKDALIQKLKDSE